jgi:hypothetical protein
MKTKQTPSVQHIKGMALAQCLLLAKAKQTEASETEILGEGSCAVGLLMAVAVGCGEEGKEWAKACAKQFNCTEALTKCLHDVLQITTHAAKNPHGTRVFESMGIELSQEGGFRG